MINFTCRAYVEGERWEQEAIGAGGGGGGGGGEEKGNGWGK